MTTADYVPEKRHALLTPGRALQIARELQELSQSELARRSGIAQSAISAFESGAQEMGLRRVRVLAKVLGVHPAVIAFPDYAAPVKKSGMLIALKPFPAPAAVRAKKAASRRPSKAAASVLGRLMTSRAVKKAAKVAAPTRRAKKASPHA